MRDSNKRITRNDVAKLAGVSPSTVSYVLNDGPRQVSAELRERVLEAVEELDYSPSDVARSLRSSKTKTLGLMVTDPHDSFYGDIIRAVERVCFEQGYAVILCHTSNHLEREMRYAQVLRNRQVDGVIAHSIAPDLEPLMLLERAGIPTIVLERSSDDLICLNSDDIQGGYLATRHLLDLGHTRMGTITREDMSTSQGRIDGHKQALAEAGIAFDSQLVEYDTWGFEAGANSAERLLNLPDPPTAILTHDDNVAVGAMKAIHDYGLRIPDDISVVGYDDVEVAAFVVPPLTTIAVPKYEMGKRAAELMLNLLSGEEAPEPKTIVLSVELIVRESSGPRRA